MVTDWINDTVNSRGMCCENMNWIAFAKNKFQWQILITFWDPADFEIRQICHLLEEVCIMGFVQLIQKLIDRPG
jgi:hypothetical protein